MPCFSKGSKNGCNVLSRLFRFGRDLNGCELLKLYIVEFAINPFDPADIHVLNHLTSFRIDRHRTAWAFPRHPFHGSDQSVAIGVAAGLLYGRVDQMQSIVNGHPNMVRSDAVADTPEAFYEGLVHR